MALQVALPQRQYRFEGEVPESCAAILRRWPRTGRGGSPGGQGGKRRAGKGAKESHHVTLSLSAETTTIQPSPPTPISPSPSISAPTPSESERLLNQVNTEERSKEVSPDASINITPPVTPGEVDGK
ncbi:hypothetical protein RRG08_030714 [Elysia crispata]|uniref:Uncharacterized protein n=1 Tax=Elysia crispata TaxID=231223 RepID=A0AAE0Y482_9GAST|nr:hypothetical protein RRG08_030714 [Elysia crispata]